MNEQIAAALIAGIFSVRAAVVSGVLSTRAAGPIKWSRLWLTIALVGLLVGGVAVYVVYSLVQNSPQVSFSEMGGKMQCSASGNYIYFCPVRVQMSGLPSNARLLFWERLSHQSDWHPQTTSITSLSLGEWEALLPVGSELTPPKNGDLFDIAVTVVTGSQQNGTTSDPFSTALVSASLQEQAIQLPPPPDLLVVKITKPASGETVPGRLVAEGTYENLPSLLQLWLIPDSQETTMYYPQGAFPKAGPALLQSNTTWTSPPPRDNGSWTSPPIFLGPATKDTRWDLYVGLVGSKGQDYLKQYLIRGNETHDFPGLSSEDLHSHESELITSTLTLIYGPQK